MRDQNGICSKRIGLSFVVWLTLFLSGCTALTQPSSPGPVSKSVSAQLVSSQTVAAGNAENGRNLFMGYAHFQNDGPPCMGCHSVGENGLLGGGAMGPDLTNVTTRRKQAKIASILSNGGPSISPVMQPIFTEHPLTESEQADLIAFLGAAVGQPETNKEWVVVGISVAGFVAAVAVLGFIYRNRLRSVRRSLVEKAQAENQ